MRKKEISKYANNPRLKSRARSNNRKVVNKPDVGQPKFLENYVTVEYIGTSGCFTSSLLYGQLVNISVWVGEVWLAYKTGCNIGDVNHSH